MTRYLLDTSALLAHHFDEPGAEQVQTILESDHGHIASPTRLEFLIRLVAAGADPRVAERTFADYLHLFEQVRPIDDAAVQRAWMLRQAATDRLPVVDALIAGSAAVLQATLVHRDPHFAAIPAALLEQLALPDGT